MSGVHLSLSLSSKWRALSVANKVELENIRRRSVFVLRKSLTGVFQSYQRLVVIAAYVVVLEDEPIRVPFSKYLPTAFWSKKEKVCASLEENRRQFESPLRLFTHSLLIQRGESKSYQRQEDKRQDKKNSDKWIRFLLTTGGRYYNDHYISQSDHMFSKKVLDYMILSN